MSSAAARGWGSGWPRCSTAKIKVLKRADGLRVPVREEILPLVAWLMDETERRGYDIRPDWTWGYACRAIRGSNTASNHSWGLAVDINAPKNPMLYGKPGWAALHRAGRTDMPEWMPQLWKAHGFTWGGDYATRQDCFTGDTMIETVDGPRAIRDLADRETMMLSTTEDPRSGEVRSAWVKAPTRSYGWAPTYAVTVRRRGVRATFRTTASHRWPIQSAGGTVRFVTSADLASALRQGDRVPAMRYPAMEQTGLDAEAVARGIVWGDGSTYNTHDGRTPQCQVRLYGPKIALRPHLEPFTRYWRDCHAPSGIAAMGLPGDFKQLPHPDSDIAIIAGFFAGWFATDGHATDGIAPSLSSSDPSAVSWLRAVAPRLGITITSVAVQPAGRSGYGSTKPNHTVVMRSIDERLLLRDDQRGAGNDTRRWFGWTVESVKPTGIVEEVFCPTVEGRHVVALSTPSVPVLSGQSMHFEFLGTPADAKRLTEQLKGSPGATIKTTWRRGDKGADVAYLQGLLNLCWKYRITDAGRTGGAQIKADGVYGKATETAVREFQRYVNRDLWRQGKKVGIPEDGVVDQAVLYLLAATATKK